MTKLFYGSIGLAASLGFFLTLYWSLLLNSSITSLIQNIEDQPFYLWPYAILTFAAIILFGVNVLLFVYRWRRFGPPKLKSQGGTGLGSFVGIAASACPVCGSALLAAIGIAGGLAAFPLGGLELKALSVGLFTLPIWLTRRDLKRKRLECEGGICPAPRGHSFKKEDGPWLVGVLAVVVVFATLLWNMLKSEPIIARALSQSKIVNPQANNLYTANVSAAANTLFDEVAARVLPERGIQSKIVLGASVVKLVQSGVIDREKFLGIYQDPEGSRQSGTYGASRDGLPPELKDILDKPDSKPIRLTRKNANYYVNLLWPLGLANYMSSNKSSPLNGKSLFNFASTGGWNLGKEENGGAYFNKFNIVELTPEQEALVVKIAQNTYRPCCNNSTFFQDCNHGSALLGLLQLGAAQGLTEDELYKEALAFNSFWFPNNYIQTALYFKAVKSVDWNKVDPKVVMGKDFSSISGWYTNVQGEVARLGLLPEIKDGARCGV